MPLPDWIKPMAATLTQERFVGEGWTFEQKHDGIRLMVFREGGQVRMYSRTRREQDLPGVRDAVLALPVRDIILDGELTWDRESGFHVFDILWLDGRDLTALALEERRRILDGLELQPPLYRTPAIEHPEPWELARQRGWEGVIAKRLDSPYEQKRSKHWLKMKCELSRDFIVGGFTEPQGSRVGLGALLVGYHEGTDFVFAGKVGTGFDGEMLTRLRARLDRAIQPTSPFTRATGLPRVRVHWVKPEIVVTVSFIEWTVHGKLRHARVVNRES